MRGDLSQGWPRSRRWSAGYVFRRTGARPPRRAVVRSVLAGKQRLLDAALLLTTELSATRSSRGTDLGLEAVADADKPPSP